MPYVEIDGSRLFYRLDEPRGHAAAPVLVLSHALGVTHAMWHPQCDALRERFRVLALDGRGHGASTVTPGPYRIEQLGRDVLALADALGIARFHFCGLSMGGLVGQWLASRAPSRVDRLVLASTTAHFADRRLFDARIDAVRSGGMAPLVEGILERWFTTGFRAARPAAVDAVRRQLLACAPEGYAANCAAVRDADLRTGLAAIEAPTLVISGTGDVGATPEQGRSMAAAIRGARSVELPAAHLSNVESAEAFNALLREHLS